MTWYPQRSVCHADMEMAAVRRRFDAIHGEKTGRRFHDGTGTTWTENETPMTPYAFDDGVTLWVSTEDLTPDDNFLGQPEPTTEVVADGGTS